MLADVRNEELSLSECVEGHGFESPQRSKMFDKSRCLLLNETPLQVKIYITHAQIVSVKHGNYMI